MDKFKCVIKKVTSTHKYIALLLTKIRKSRGTGQVMPSIYKLLAFVLANNLYNLWSNNNIMLTK